MPAQTSLPYTVPKLQRYVIHDRPLETTPKERIRHEGPEVVSVRDLLGLALGQENPALQAVAEYGAQILTTFHTVADVQGALNVSEDEATRILAVLALGRRLFTPTQGSLPYVRGLGDVHALYHSMLLFAKEQLRVLLINSRYQIMHEEVIAIGSIDELTISPRDVFQPAMERRATAIILVHNHPSGHCDPSQHDFDFTDRVYQVGELLGIPLLDHVVIASDGAASCLNAGERLGIRSNTPNSIPVDKV